MKDSVDAVHKLSDRKWVYSSGSWSRYKKINQPLHIHQEFLPSALQGYATVNQAVKQLELLNGMKLLKK